MGLFKKDLDYDAGRCQSAVSELQQTKSHIADTAPNINAQINIINSAKGFQERCGGSLDGGAITAAADCCNSMVDEIVARVADMVDTIEKYNNASGLERFGASLGMGITKIFEGVGSLLENIGDGAVSIVGWTAGTVVGLGNSELGKEIKESTADFVEKDHVGDFFYNQYENGVLSDMNDVSNFSHKSKAAGCFKVAGAIAGYVALDAVTGGTASIALNGLAGVGRKTQEKLQERDENGNRIDFNKAFAAGLVEGTKDAALTYGFQKLDKVRQTSKGVDKADDVLKASDKGDDLLRLTDKGDNVLRLTDKADDAAKVADKANDAAKAADKASDAAKASQKVEKVTAEILDENGKVIGKTKVEITSEASKSTSQFQKAKEAIASKASKAKEKVSSAKEAVSSKASTVKDGIGNSKAGKIVTKPIEIVGNTAAKHPKITKTLGTVYAVNEQTKANNASQQFRISSNSDAMSQGLEDAKRKLKSDNEAIIGNVDTNYEPKYGTTPAANTSNNSGGSSTPSGNTNRKTNTGGSSGGGSSSGGSGGGGGYSGGGYTPTATASAGTGNGSQQFRKTKTVSDSGASKDTEKKPATTPTPTETKKPTTQTTTPSTPTTTTPSTPTTNTTTPSTPTTTTPPSGNGNNNVVTTQASNPGTTQTTQHTGGGYSGSGGYRGYTGGGTSGTEAVTETASVEDVLSESTTSIDDVIKGSKYTKIPTSSRPITTTASGSSGSAAIPVVAGLSAAAAAGIGAKVYMDRKKNNENGEYDEIETDEWSGEDTLNLNYDDSSDTETYLDDDDDYSYQAEEQTERYDARNNEELADLQ